jgi:NAD(P)-dependent dehydrogenase (short-subunit alcohol dehydrogenase family)
MQLDLADLGSISRFATAFKEKYTQLNILINNAGLMYPPKREVTRQGFEAQMGTNHFGHFALTGLLLDTIKKTPHSRVVTQSSLAHLNATIHWDDLNWEKKYSRVQAYGQSKLANLLFTYELDRQFKAHNIDAIATASHPGISKTNLFRTAGFARLLVHLIAQKADMGVLPILRAATEESLTGGEFIGPGQMMGVRGYPEIVKSNKVSYNTQVAKELWAISEKMTTVHFNF